MNKRMFVGLPVLLSILPFTARHAETQASLARFNYGDHVFAKESLKIRAKAGKGHTVVASVKQGETLVILDATAQNEETHYGITAPWYPVRFGNVDGWVFGGLIYAGDPYMETATPEEIAEFLRANPLWRSDGKWYHQLEFLKDGEVANSCFGECAVTGRGVFTIKNRIVHIDLADGQLADFKSADCRIFALQKRKGLHCGRENVYFLKR